MAKNTEKPSNGAKSGRDSKGRFTVGNKGGGRKEKPEELKDIHKKTIPEIWHLAQHSANEKVRLDALKFLTEMDIGKARQSVDANIDDGKLDVTIEVV
jgi:hypothetical protein